MPPAEDQLVNILLIVVVVHLQVLVNAQVLHFSNVSIPIGVGALLAGDESICPNLKGIAQRGAQVFRGLVFGCLKEKSRLFAYILSCALFAFLHVWTAAVSNWDLGYLILMLQYLVPGLVFAWAYEHSGTLWTSILLHMLVNALSLFTIAS